MEVGNDAAERGSSLILLANASPALTPRQLEIVTLLCDGLTAVEIAAKLGIKDGTVEMHRGAAMLRLKAKNIAMLVRAAIRHGFVEA